MVSTVVVAGPNRIERLAIAEALKDTTFRLVADTGRYDNLLPLVERFHPWGVVVDLGFPGPSGRAGDGGVGLIRRLLDAHPQVTVVALFDDATANHVPEAKRSGASEAVRMPVKEGEILGVFDKLANPRGETATRKLMAARFRKALTVTYKCADDGFFARRRVAMTTEIGLMEVVLQADEILSPKRVLVAEVEIPGESPLKARLQVARIEPLAGLGRFSVALTWADMKPEDRERLQGFCRRLKSAQVPSAVPIVAG